MKNLRLLTYSSFLIAIISLTILSSCENDFEEKQTSGTPNSLATKLELVEGTIKVENKNILKNIFNSYKKNVTQQNDFNKEIRNLQNKGFKPLTPIFDENDTEKIKSFFLAKKQHLQKRNIEFGMTSKSATSDEEIDFDDDLVLDPVLSGLLNEDREIYVSDSLYKYTETGLYFCLIKDKQKLYSYLSKLSPIYRNKQITNRAAPYNTQIQKGSYTSKIIQEVTEVSDGINRFIPITVVNSGGGGSTQAPTPVLVTPRLVKQNLGICTIEKQGVFEHIFGESESDEDYFDDGKRVKISFFNQNYFLYGAIGCSVRFQKRVKILGISGWQKSYPESIELGVNSIKYDYDFSVPAINNSLYISGPSVYYTYKGQNYNQFGQFVPTLPTENPGFPFKTDSNQNVVEIHIFDNKFLQFDYTMSNSQANSIIDDGLKALAKELKNKFGVNQADVAELEKGLNSEEMKYNIVKAVPFSNKITFVTMGVKWTHNDDNAITQYFDHNYLLSLPSGNNPKIGDWIKALVGGKKYSNVKADIYGAALYNGVWKGRRLTKF